MFVCRRPDRPLIGGEIFEHIENCNVWQLLTSLLVASMAVGSSLALPGCAILFLVLPSLFSLSPVPRLLLSPASKSGSCLFPLPFVAEGPVRSLFNVHLQLRMSLHVQPHLCL